jgi:histidyl-tRNA synthetase
MIGHEDLGSVCSGGRYDSLVADGKKTYPGVGLSIGVSRIISRLISRGLVVPSRRVPTCVLVAVNDETERRHAEKTAMTLRKRGIPADVSPGSQKFGKQIRFADRRGIPYVWFTTDEGEQVKDIRSGEQTPADPATWEPAAEDLRPVLSEAS